MSPRTIPPIPPPSLWATPTLKPAHANNYDLLYERYLNPAGILQAGFFSKQITNTLISTSYTATSGAYQGDLVSQWINASNAHLYGFRGFLPAAALHAARPAGRPSG